MPYKQCPIFISCQIYLTIVKKIGNKARKQGGGKIQKEKMK